MKVLVIGAGIIGVTTAYALRCRGHEVTVLERQDGPAREASFANGALLTPSMADPWNGPGCLRALLGSLLRSDSALQLRLRALPSLAGWGIDFVRCSSPKCLERSALANIRLALHSKIVMTALCASLGTDFGRSARGSLRVFRDRQKFKAACAMAHRRSGNGLPFRALSPAEAVSLEPALQAISGQLSGALHFENDEVGDAYQFSEALTEQAGKAGVCFHFGTEVKGLEVRAGKVLAFTALRERYIADHYVVATGSYSSLLLQRTGISIPVRPAKGYSVTIPEPGLDPPLSVPIVDDDWHAAIVPLGSGIRVAGTAEFAGYDLSLDPARVDNLLNLVRLVLPQVRSDPACAKAWCGLRAMSTDGVPIIGSTPLPNLYINTGHGHLGWTMAAASAELLSDILTGRQPMLKSAPYALARFRR